MSTANRSLTQLTGTSRDVHKPKRSFPAGTKSISLKAKRMIYTGIAEGKSNKQIREDMMADGIYLSIATVANYREDGEPDWLWEDELCRVNTHGAIVALRDYGVTPGTFWRVSQADDGTITLKPA